jgi:thiol-disulfide isomerase/thioredoxin
MSRGWWMVVCGGVAAAFATLNDTAALAQHKADDLLKAPYVPRQRDVEIETPSPAELAKCKVEIERGKVPGFVVYGPSGQVLRRFVDSNRDGSVDQFRYYQHGIEVYRDMDTNKNGSIDQSRWLNLGGTRWGIDTNEDGRIDQWKMLSAAEASKEAIDALIANDAAALQTLMITAADLRQLGVNSQLAAKIVESTSEASTRMRTVLTKTKVITPRTKWFRFDAQMPGVIPADEGKATDDLHVYENAMVMVEPGPAMVQIGEMIRVGEVWKLTQVPFPIEPDAQGQTITSSGFLMQPILTDAAGGGAIAQVTPAMQKLIEDLQKLDQNQPQLGTASKVELAAYNSRRADMLLELMSQAGNEEEKAQFLKQCVDGLAAAVQMDVYPDGITKIKQLEAGLEKSSPQSPVLPYIIYRRLKCDHAIAMKVDDTDKRTAAQKELVTQLVAFVEKHPKAEDAPEAMLELAVTEEFAGNLKGATDWYRKLAQQPGGGTEVEKAAGAIRRLELKGKPFALQGAGLTTPSVSTTAYRGKVLLVYYWATWCQPCKQDLPALRAIHQQYQSQGFEIVGVCLDVPTGTRQQQVVELSKHLEENKVRWPQIFEAGGLDSKPATQYGIITLPTMFLIDQKGEVVSRNSSVDELKAVLPQLLAPKTGGVPKNAAFPKTGVPKGN